MEGFVMQNDIIIIGYHQSNAAVTLATALLLVARIHTSSAGTTNLNVPDRPTDSYVRLGDINLGGLFSITEDRRCGSRLRVPILQQMVESMAFAVDRVNRDKTLMPHVRLGFALLDDCGKESIAAAQSLRFLPRVPDDDSKNSCQVPTTTPGYNSYGQKLDEYYNVVGTIGPLRSSNSIAVSNVLGPAHVPQVSFMSTSDVLSRKSIHPYFMRVVPPDAYQMKAILEFISRQGWSYISVLYSEGSYGEPAYEVIKKSVSELGLCIAAQHKLYENMLTRDYCKVIEDLMRFKNSRVVILVSGDKVMVKTFEAVHRINARGRFIWVGTDGWAERISSLSPVYRDVVLGSFTTTFYATPADDFNAYFRSLKPSKNKNPWFRQFWERMFNCSYTLRTCDESMDVSSVPDYSVSSQAIYGIDAVYSYAHALTRLLADRCPRARGAEARACVNGSTLLGYLRNTSFNGRTGFVEFDENGDRMGRYVIKQAVRDVQPTSQTVNHQSQAMISQMEVSVVDATNVISSGRMTWQYVEPLVSGFGPGSRFPGTIYGAVNPGMPTSVCSRMCEPREQKIQLEPPCCWECRMCRENEFLTANFTSCRQCPLYSWPDVSTNYTSCVSIDPTYPVTYDPIVVIMLCFSVAGILSTLLVSVNFVAHRNSRVIKASSRELSFFQLFAIFLGYMTMIVFMIRPSDTLCATSYFMFSLSFNWLYAPLLIKTIRIYRIFQSANEGRRTMKVVSPLSQMILTLSIIFGQVVICFSVSLVAKPTARLASSSRIDKHVELFCDLTHPGLASFIAYNFTLVCLCAVFAFKTRKLPDNFNESRFISMCVFTTLVIWSVIVPSFVTASREYLRALLLATALLLNHTVALVFLFVTRLCAVCYVPDAPFSDQAGCNTNPSVLAHSRVQNSSSVAPINTIASSSHFLKPGPSG